MRARTFSLVGLFVATTAFGTDFEVVKKSDFLLKPANIVHEGKDTYVLKKEDSNFTNTYVVNVHGLSDKNIDGLKKFGKISHIEKNDYGIMEVAKDRVEGLSHTLHHSGLACGTVLSLETAGFVSDIAVADPVPVVPVSESILGLEGVISNVSTDRMRETVEWLSSFTTRHHSSRTGKQIAGLLVEKYRSLAGSRSDITIEEVSNTRGTNQSSIRVRIEGSVRPDEVIVLGSHIDSISWQGSSPGADDNASGTATNLEIFRVLMESGIQLERTLEIHGYAAEEIGLVGSANMARDYRDRGVNVVAMVQHDMNLYADGGVDKIWFVTNNTNRSLNQSLIALNEQYVHAPYGEMALSGGSSDHASWTRQGFAAAFPFEHPSRYNRSIHTSRDTIANSGAFNQAKMFAQLGITYVAHFGGKL